MQSAARILILILSEVLTGAMVVLGLALIYCGVM